VPYVIHLTVLHLGPLEGLGRHYVSYLSQSPQLMSNAQNLGCVSRAVLRLPLVSHSVVDVHVVSTCLYVLMWTACALLLQQQPSDWKCHCFCKCGRGGDSLCDCPGRCRCKHAFRQRRFFPKDLICIRQERTFQRIVAKATDTEPAKMENEKITAPIEPSESSVTSQCN